MRETVLLIIFCTLSSLFAQSISLNQTKFVNPSPPLTIQGSYSLDASDSLKSIDWKEQNEQSWNRVSTIDTVNHTFAQTINTNWSDGRYVYLFRLVTKQNNGQVVSATVIVDRTPPNVVRWKANPAFMNLTTSAVTVGIRFSEPVRDSAATIHLISVNEQDSLQIYPVLIGQDSLSIVLPRTLFSDTSVWKKKPRLSVKGYRDTLDNKMVPVILHPFSIDLHEPAPPGLTGSYPAIFNGVHLEVKGRKEFKSQLYVQDSLYSEFNDQNSWTVQLQLPEDKLYHFRFYQVDSLGNPGDSTVLLVLADHRPPELLTSPVFTLKNGKAGNQYGVLTLNFSENVVINSLDEIQLKSESGGSVHFSSDSTSTPAAIQRLYLYNSTAIQQIQKWISQKDSVTLTIPPNSVEDMAGNVTTDPIMRPVVMQVQNLVAAFTPETHYLNSKPEIERDTLRATIILQPGNTDSLLFLLRIRNSKGTSVHSSVHQVNLNIHSSFSTNPGKIIRIGGGGTSWDTLRWVFPVAALPDGRYQASISVQSFLQASASLFRSFYFWVDSRAPELISIAPIAGEEFHYISPKPEFILKFRWNSMEAPLDSVNIVFDNASRYHSAPGRFIEPMVPLTEEPGTFVYSCNDNGISLTTGIRTLNFYCTDKAGNRADYSFTYRVISEQKEKVEDLYNYPNPFNPRAGEVTHITFFSSNATSAELFIYDLSFHLVYYRKYAADELGLGTPRKTIHWNGRNLRGELAANGVYLARVVMGNEKSPILKIMVNNK